MAVQLRVYDPTNTTLLGTLAEAHGIGWFTDLRVPGTAVFTLDVASTVDRALLQPRRVVRVRIDGTDREAYIVEDTPAELKVANEKPTVTYQCAHLQTWLGYQRGGAVLWPYGGLTGQQQSPRWFGPMSFDFPPVVRPEPTTDGPLTRAGWPDPRAERLVFDTRAVYRRELSGNMAHAGEPSRMWFTCSAWTEARVWFDGAELTGLASAVGDTTIHAYDLPYDGLDHVVCIDAAGTPPAGRQNSLGWTWATLRDDANGDPNLLYNRLFTTFNSTTYTGPVAPTAPYWQAWEEWTTYPGVTVGFVADVAFTEAQARGLLPVMTWDFDADDDSAAVAWQYVFTHAFPVTKLGPLMETLAAWKAEVEMTPASVLRIHQLRGTDKTGTVTVTAPFGLSATGRGPVATRYLYETEGGFGEAIDTGAETAWDVAMEDVAQLASDLNPESVIDAIVDQLTADSSTWNELAVTLPDTVEPYVDVVLGDRVTCQYDADGSTGAVRLTSFQAQVDDATGRIRWNATAEPFA